MLDMFTTVFSQAWCNLVNTAGTPQNYSLIKADQLRSIHSKTSKERKQIRKTGRAVPQDRGLQHISIAAAAYLLRSAFGHHLILILFSMLTGKIVLAERSR